MTGPIQCDVPPISAIASTVTEYLRSKDDPGSAYCRYIAAGAPAAHISAPEITQAIIFSRSVGTPVHSAASSSSRSA